MSEQITMGPYTGTVHGNAARFDAVAYATLPSEYSAAVRCFTPTQGDYHNNYRTELHATITAPKAAHRYADYPVIVYIHGGAYFEGSRDDISGLTFAEDKVVVVSIDYRLGIQDFTPFAAEEPHHYRGIDDCAVALTWVQENIETFGGDPTNVTVMGNSAGGGIALWLARRDHYTGLFRRLWVSSPAFPRGGDRRSATRWALSAPVTQTGLERLPRRKVVRAETSLRRRYFTDLAFGPHPFNAKELVTLPTVVTYTTDECADFVGVKKLQASRWSKYIRKYLAKGLDALPKYIEQLPDDTYFAQLTSDSMIRRWVERVAAARNPWVIEFAGEPALHCEDLPEIFGTGKVHDIAVIFARGYDPLWQPYGQRRSVMSMRLDGSQDHIITDPLAHVRTGFMKS
ncbi:hydrolase [Corynebacterium diphtheriae]|nr:hydrolase [Corynebacterium diphtheriae]